jgi:hypothetical protein
MKNQSASNLETSLKVGPALNLIKALGDAIVCVGLAGPDASLLDGTLQSLGFLIIDKATEIGEFLEV